MEPSMRSKIWNLQPHAPTSREGGEEGWGLNEPPAADDLINLPMQQNPPQKRKRKGSGNFRAGKTSTFQKGGTPPNTRGQDPSRSCPVQLFM